MGLKLVHLADLHLGKRVNGFSMLEDQRFILEKVLDIIDEERPNGVLIAGDVYDRSVPPEEAIELLDWFLVELSGRGLMVCMISGNHDSAERMAFGGRLMEGSGVYISHGYNGQTVCVRAQDEYGPVNIYLLPFIKPIHVRGVFPDEDIATYTDAVRAAIDHMEVDTAERNVLVAHQFVTGAARCESEEVTVGGLDNVEVQVFDCFDYVALGHIHGPQSVGRSTVRYCGTPLKYSFSEVSHKKSVTIVEMGQKGHVDIRTVPLVPMRDMAEVRGTYEQLTFKGTWDGAPFKDAYLHATLTDEYDIPDAVSKLTRFYPNLMKLDYDNTRTRTKANIAPAAESGSSPMELLEEFYLKQNGRAMPEPAREYALALIEKLKEEIL